MDVKMPANRDLSTEYSKTLSAQLGIAPNMLASQAQYQPVQSANTLQNLNYMLMGTPEQSYDTQVYSPAVYNKDGNYRYGKIPAGVAGTIQYPSLPDPRGGGGGGGGSGIGGGGIFSGNDPFPKYSPLNHDNLTDLFTGNPLGPLDSLFGGGGKSNPGKLMSPSGYQTVHHTMAAQRGLLDLYTNDIAPQLGASERAQTSLQRTNDIADVARLGPEAMAAMRASDTGTTALLDQLTKAAGEGMDAGSSLGPLQRQFEQQIRSGQSARGMGYGPGDVYNEGLGVAQFGQQLKQQREQQAGNVVGMRKQIYGDPFERILNRQGSGQGMNSQAMQQAMGMGQGGIMSFLNPESGYAQDLHNTNFNAMISAAMANANNKNAMIGAGIQAFGSMAGGALAGGFI